MSPALAASSVTTIYSSSIRPEEWTGWASKNVLPWGITLISKDGTLTWTPPVIRPGRPHTIALNTFVRAWTSNTDPVPILIQGKAYVIPSGSWQPVTHTVDPDRPLTLQVANVRTLDTRITLTSPDLVPANPCPADVLAVDALVPIVTDAMYWNRGRWDLGRWNKSAPYTGTLVWDERRWDESYWMNEELKAVWTPILGPGTRLQVTRGLDTSGPVLTAQAGSMVLEATDGLDPRALGMHWGTPIRVYHWPTATVIWTGWVTDVAVTPAKTGRGHTTITATDMVARLVGINRDGARPASGRTESWRQRLARLMTSAPADCTYSVASSSDMTVCPTAWETDLASHLDALVATTGGAWYVAPDGGLRIHAQLPTQTPELVFSDEYLPPIVGEIIYYTAGPATWSASKVIAAVEATTHDAAPDESGAWRAADRTATVTDSTATAAWGGMTVKVDVMTPADGPALEDAAKRLLKRASNVPLMDEVEWWPASKLQRDTAHAMAYAAALDLLTSCAAHARGEFQRSLTARITHDITPTTWHTTATLTTREQEEQS